VRLRRLARSPLVFWSAAATLAAVTALFVAGTVNTAAARAARYGTPRAVVIATRDLDAGSVIRRRDTEVRRLPAALVPRGSVAEPPVGRAVVVPVFRGEPLLRQKLAPWGVRGAAALVPAGSRAVTIPSGPAPPPVRVGDVVDVLASFDRDVAGDGEPTFPVALAARVVAVAEGTVTVAVRIAEVTKVVFATTAGVVSVVLRGAG
jgi:Flp pilus assembly protein CpaB